MTSSACFAIAVAAPLCAFSRTETLNVGLSTFFFDSNAMLPGELSISPDEVACVRYTILRMEVLQLLSDAVLMTIMPQPFLIKSAWRANALYIDLTLRSSLITIVRYEHRTGAQTLCHTKAQAWQKCNACIRQKSCHTWQSLSNRSNALTTDLEKAGQLLNHRFSSCNSVIHFCGHVGLIQMVRVLKPWQVVGPFHQASLHSIKPGQDSQECLSSSFLLLPIFVSSTNPAGPQVQGDCVVQLKLQVKHVLLDWPLSPN